MTAGDESRHDEAIIAVELLPQVLVDLVRRAGGRDEAHGVETAIARVLVGL